MTLQKVGHLLTSSFRLFQPYGQIPVVKSPLVTLRTFASSSPQSIFSNKPNELTAPPNLTQVKSFEEFSSQVFPTENQSNTLFAIFYYAPFSTSAKTIQPAFYKMAQSNPSTQFMTVNVDECPRAAYYADITAVPSILVCYKDDAYRKLISPDQLFKTQNLIPEAQAAIDAFHSEPQKQKFRSKHAWYTHNIASDNHNLHQVGWPTS